MARWSGISALCKAERRLYAKLLQGRDLPLRADRAGQFGLSSEWGANPPLFELSERRLTGKVCSGGSGIAEGREGAREGGRRPVGDGSLRAAWTGSGRGSRRRQALERSIPLSDCRESRAGASPDSVFAAAKRNVRPGDGVTATR